jgi:hypothetical protein
MTSGLTKQLDDLRVRLKSEFVAPRNVAGGLAELSDLVAESSRKVDALASTDVSLRD